MKTKKTHYPDPVQVDRGIHQIPWCGTRLAETSLHPDVKITCRRCQKLRKALINKLRKEVE